jgi:hypothetical protein
VAAAVQFGASPEFTKRPDLLQVAMQFAASPGFAQSPEFVMSVAQFAARQDLSAVMGSPEFNRRMKAEE